MKGNASGLFQLSSVCGWLALTLSSCETVPAPAPVTPAVGAGTSPAATSATKLPMGFLMTDYAPLQRWLDERFEVEYRNMTPELVFDQPPIADIRYETHRLPQDAPLFDLKSPAMSRREILHKISEFWNLEMSIQAEGGTPSYVLVTGR